MKKLIFTLCILFTFSFSQLNAEMHYTVFPHGFTVGLNENVVIDIDQDGLNDFYINGWQDELGFVPIFAQGCFAGTGNHTSFGAYELQPLHLGDYVHLTFNPYFIDGDRGSITGPNGQIANGWAEGEDQYIGFMVWVTGVYGWMKVSFDTELQQLTIKEWAWSDQYGIGIIVGDGATTVEQIPVSVYDLAEEVSELSLSPNPAVNQILLSFTYQSDADLNLVVINSTGQEVYNKPYADLPYENDITIRTDQFADGLYIVQLKTKDGVRVEKFLVAK